MSFHEIEKELLKDKSFKKYFEQNKLSHEIAVSIMEARISKGLSQEDLAKKVGTKQPSIARLEKGNYLPSLRFLEKITAVLDLKTDIEFQEKNKSATFTEEFTKQALFSCCCDTFRHVGKINFATI